MADAPGMTESDPKQIIGRICREYAEAYNSGQLERVLDFFADDAVTLPPDQAPVIGRAALREHYEQAFLREVKRELSFASLRVESSGDLLCDAGQWWQSASTPDGKISPATGYYVSALRQIRGRWKFVATTFNLLQAPAPVPDPAKK